MMPQGILPFQYEKEASGVEVTGLAGLPLYLELAKVAKTHELIARQFRHLGPSQGWTVIQQILAVVLLNLSGGDCVDDLDRLNGDSGFGKVLRQAEVYRFGRRKRRAVERRWRKERTRSVPSPSAAHRFLALFHNPKAELKRREGTAYIPGANAMLRGLTNVNTGLVAFCHRHQPVITTATLDMDATLIETNKKEALFCYKHFRSYQPLNTWWAEMGMVLHTEFRDGNVPAGYEQLRVFREALSCLPDGVEKVFLRSDTAGYQWNLLRYCAEGIDKRFGEIEFAVGCSVTKEFRQAVAEVAEGQWHTLNRMIDGIQVDTGQQWSEVCFVPNGQGYKKDGPTYRFLAIREPLRQLEIPGMEAEELPFPVMEFGQVRYKLFGVVTNRMIAGDDLIWWLRERCGKSEEVHAVMKDDLAGGQLPSRLFGANAAWWQMMILAHNLNAIMKRLVLGAGWQSKRMKAVRYHVINLPGRVVNHANRLWVRVSEGLALDLLVAARQRLLALAHGPSG
jgi:hypothetical protein